MSGIKRGVRTSRALICNSDTAARRDVLANTSSSDLADVRRSVRFRKAKVDMVTLCWIKWRVVISQE